MPWWKVKYLTFIFIAGMSGVAQASELADELPATVAQQYVQVWLGSTEADDAWSLKDSEGSDFRGDYSSLPVGGGVGQMLWGDRAQYGFEGGGIVSWKNDDIDFAGRNGELLIAVDTDLFFMDLFMGGIVAVRPSPWLRLYAAAGPSVAWAHLSGDDDEDDEDPDGTGVIVTGPGSFLVINADDNTDDFSFSFYGRAGIEIELGSGFTFGASARYADHEFDFDNRGELKLDEVQWFLTLGGRI